MKIIAWLFRNWPIFVLLFGAVGIYYTARLDNKMHERAKFTLGRIAGWHQTAKSGRMFGFRFEVGGVGYGGASGWESGMDEADGSPCLVEYDKPGPAAERRSLRRGHPRQHPPAAGQRLAHAAFSGAAVDSGHGAGKKVGEPLVAIRP